MEKGMLRAELCAIDEVAETGVILLRDPHAEGDVLACIAAARRFAV